MGKISNLLLKYEPDVIREQHTMDKTEFKMELSWLFLYHVFKIWRHMAKSSLEFLKKCVLSKEVCYKHYAILKKRLKSKKAICSIIFPN